jgi:type II restriction enzyme
MERPRRRHHAAETRLICRLASNAVILRAAVARRISLRRCCCRSSRSIFPRPGWSVMSYILSAENDLMPLMNLHLPSTGLDNYKSASQRARVATESWGTTNLYCPACISRHIHPAPHNTAAIDYLCRECQSPFQLKSQGRKLGRKIVDSAYSKMKQAIVEDRTPNLYVMHYDSLEWTVKTVILIPRFAFALSALECRKPLAPTARRAGWVGCNILLYRIPMDAQIQIVQDGQIRSTTDVRSDYNRIRPLQKLDMEMRGWTLDVLRTVRSLNTSQFSLAEVYAHSNSLAQLHPNNRHVRDKIRQQLQVLRDLGFVDFLGGGNYRMC